MFMNSSPKRWLADCTLSSWYLTHLLQTPHSKQNHCKVTIDLLIHYTQDHFLFKNVDGRQIAKNRHITTPSTSQMPNLPCMTSV